MSAEPVTQSGSAHQAAPTGLLAWVASVDHKKIGVMYILLAALFLIVGGLEAVLIRIQLAVPNNTFLSPQLFNQLFTMHGTTMVFLVGMPVFTGMSNYLVPLMIGARDVAFPRLNAMSFWMLPFGAFLLYFSLLTGSAPDAGWFAYAPLSTKPYNLGPGIDYWIVSLVVMGIGSIGGAINIVATVLCMRAPGMSLQRVPLFVWIMLMQALLILITIPPLNSALALLSIDRWLDAAFFQPQRGGSALLWQHFFWIFGHPEVYVFALPAFAMISEIIPVFSRKPIYGYAFVAGSSTVILLLSYGVWAHHMFAVGLGTGANIFFSVMTMLIALPTGVKIFNWTATMWGGAIRLTTAMLFAIAFLIQFVIGGLTGIMFAAVPIDWQMTDTYFVVAHFHYVLVGGVVFAVFAAVYYWFPKITGRMLDERLGKWQFWLWVVGFNGTFMIQHLLGAMGMPRRVYTYADNPGWAVMNGVSSASVVFMVVGTVVLVWNVVKSLRSGATAGDNPWDAFTLEWATTSPPPEENFASLPQIKSRRPVWDANYPEHADWKSSATPEDRGWRPDRSRVCAWAFVVSEAVFFLLLLVSYVIFNTGPHGDGPSATSVLNVPRTAVFSVFLLTSSLTFLIAERRLRYGKQRAFRGWLGVTIVLGIVFLGGQAWEYWGLLSGGVYANSNLFAATFFTVTGFHAFHVAAGLVALAIMFSIGKDARFAARQSSPLGAVGVYWHFVDVVWIAVFATIYLGVFKP
ncbi:Cytochrome c oxidase subunit 1 [Pirellulimonas nuda]|uniref:Cytochrome c oxidase subunit 1 n=1 Tax=Pirellulimonas nuda TaxID=2528009 RepID=A0A518D8X0_9BACT|nr:cytochrome c oxidase subunit I [Pirellulimonas nuda]QDU87894.1 Cytochrome c oxidase subunit 1 [Pirellulimonas nuda]